MLPIGQALWLKELETYKEFPPMQDPASYNLDQVIAADQELERPVATNRDRSGDGEQQTSGRPERTGRSVPRIQKSAQGA